MSTMQGTRSATRKLATAARILISVLIWSLIGVSTSTSSSASQVPGLSAEAEQSPRITVLLDVFSGRPNPSWELPDQQVQTVLHMLDDVRRTGRTRQPCQTPDLGYRGLRLRIAAGSQVTDGHVFEECLEYQNQVLYDSGRAIETYLLQSMPEQLRRDLATVLPRIFR